jgi:hypothetical protein
MPNHCGNRITVTGEFKDRQYFVNEVKTTSEDGEELLDFNKIVPEPSKAELGQQPMSGNLFLGYFDAVTPNWYTWRCKHWGTKWNSYEVTLKHDEKETVYTFQTAWAPPNDNLMKAMVAKFPKVQLDLRYAERGCEFYGYWTPEKNESWKFQNDDIEPIYYSEDEEEEEEGEKEPYDYKLRPGLSLYADLYQMSG